MRRPARTFSPTRARRVISTDAPAARKGHDRWVINKIRALGSYFTKGFEGGAELRNAPNQVESIDALRRLVAASFIEVATLR